jgi:DMSO/TMAO reductase YedYZ molybdopterin-dependent catalytic subunit
VDDQQLSRTGAPPRPGSSPAPGTSRTGVPWWSAVAGVVGGAVLLAVAELVALLFSSSSAPLVAVGGAFIDVVPPAVKDLVIGLFGTWDKLVLNLSMLAVYVVVTALLGILGDRRPRLAAALLAGLGLLAAAMVLTRAQNTLVDTVPTLLGTAVAVPVLLLLLRAVRQVPTPAEAEDDPGSAWSRRRALLGIAAVGVLSALAVAGARGVTATREVARRAAEFVLPTPRTRADPIPDAAQVEVDGMPPYLTPNEIFYRIDTALAVPRIDPATWGLRIHGLVDREVVLTFDELLAEPMLETHVTLTCVSNTVGGELAGNATWIGVPVRTLLERAGVQEGADMVLSRSIDGFTASTPLEALTDDRDAVLAVAMNGEALPPEHGYPVRMVVPGLYGYVSATKWLTELQVTRFADDSAYWSTRGWSERGPIKTASRIDVPRPFASVAPDAEGAVMVGGTAWAQHRGIARVEVQIDDGDWREADLGAAVTEDTWVQWSLRWEGAAPGEHTLTVRATDGDGQLQTSQRANPAPDGATGWHTIEVTVE